MDKIIINNLDVFAYHGVYPEENEKGQHFFVSASLYTDTREAGLKDNLSLSTNYGEVCQLIHSFVESNVFQLIETIAEHLAEIILREFPLVEKVELQIFKPEAPIGLPFENVSVNIIRSWHKAYIAFGSNMGDKDKNIKDAISNIAGNSMCKNMRCSNILRTTPYGGIEQDDFLNGVLEIQTLYTPKELLDFLHGIESMANRERSIHWGPRTIDLDIIFYDNIVLETEELIIPHIDMQNRDFVLRPLSELTKFFVHPVLNKNMLQLLDELSEIHIV